MRQEFILEERLQCDGFLVSTLCRAHNLGELFFTGLEISQCQLGIDGLNIRERIDLVRYMNDVGIFKAANDVGDGIRLTNIGSKLVAKSFPLRGACNQTRYIHEFHRRRYRPFGVH